MLRLRRIVIRVLRSRPAPVLVRHDGTGLFLGPGLVLTDRAGAVVFHDTDGATTFLARHACEPDLVPEPVPAGEVVAA